MYRDVTCFIAGWITLLLYLSFIKIINLWKFVRQDYKRRKLIEDLKIEDVSDIVEVIKIGGVYCENWKHKYFYGIVCVDGAFRVYDAIRGVYVIHTEDSLRVLLNNSIKNYDFYKLEAVKRLKSYGYRLLVKGEYVKSDD